MITIFKSLPSKTFVRASRLLRRLWRDQRGSIGIITAISLTALLAFAALAADASLWMRAKNDVQGAADAAANSVGAAAASSNPANRIVAEATAIAAVNGFQNGMNGVAVTVKNPPASGGLCWQCRRLRSHHLGAAKAISGKCFDQSHGTDRSRSSSRASEQTIGQCLHCRSVRTTVEH
jgi:uncharacterized membrane protein